jgi:hypothetical protein
LTGEKAPEKSDALNSRRDAPMASEFLTAPWRASVYPLGSSCVTGPPLSTDRGIGKHQIFRPIGAGFRGKIAGNEQAFFF